ncbi:MAG: ATP synthase F1 subunit epsilon [Pirellulaceae bacterium]|nr:ATP synthase F1 subunit epsilon [Pirellulaceae bacterium]
MSKLLHCIVVTPEATALEQDAEFVALPLYDGEIGILPAHSPMIGRLGFGEMRIRSAGGATATYYLDGGFVQVADNVVSVLTSRAVPAARLNEGAAQDQLETASKRQASTPELAELRERAIAQARAQIRIARRARI